MTESFLTDAIDTQTIERAVVASLPPLQVRYEHAALDCLLAGDDVIAVIGFGSGAPDRHADARYLHLPLEPVDGPAPYEVWRNHGPVHSAQAGEIRWSSNGDYAVGVLEVDEAAHGGIVAAADHAYRALGAWIAAAPTPHILRIWNYLDAINEGDGDGERYRQFCRGRAEGMRRAFAHGFPAATAIGVRDGRHVLRIYWIAARQSGRILENPRQVSAWRYPRQYGPSAPTFARAMHAPTASPQLYVSGTAAIVGHASHHPDDFAAQLHETLANFATLLQAAGLPAGLHYGAGCTLKIYVRRAQDAACARAMLDGCLPPATTFMLLHGDICRRELLVEIDGVQIA
jgi:chorismate lyase / 3-hydroxybenzoate synthase